jgi:methionyl-tRNA formyltransferase
MRVVLISQIVPAVQGLYRMLQSSGHEVVALLLAREGAERYGDLSTLLDQVPGELDVVMPAARARVAPLLRGYEPDVAFCGGFPWKIPAEAIAVPRLGIVNGHPSLLPRYRGPSPMAWAVRNGETEVGFTFHYMDAELDTGPILAQARIPLGDEHGWEELGPKLMQATAELFPTVLERLDREDPGDPQPDGGEYFSFFEPEYVWIDWSSPAAEIARQVRAWRFHSVVPGERGALAEIDGETVRVLRVSLEPAEGRAMECGVGTIWIVETEPA